MQFICEHILGTFAEECAKNAILFMRHNNKGNQ